MKRSVAETVLDRVRVMLADKASPEDIEAALKFHYGIEPLKLCKGEAHRNPHVDNCLTCAPRWGFVGERIKIT